MGRLLTGEGTVDTKRRATFRELLPTKGAGREAVEAVLQKLASEDARLIVTEGEKSFEGQQFVEVAHEAIIQGWSRLRGWIEDNRESLRMHRRFTEDAQEWDQHGREEGYLYRGGRLTVIGEWAETRVNDLNALEGDFLAASWELNRREGAEREVQRQRELEAAQKLVESERQRAETMGLLREVSANISATLDLDATLTLIVEGAMRLTGASSGIVHLVSEDRRSIMHSVGCPDGFYHPAPRLSKKESLTRSIVNGGQPISIEDVGVDHRVNPATKESGVKSLIGVPLELSNRIIGVLYLNAIQSRQFTKDHLDLLTTIAGQAAVAIENARLYVERDQKVKELEGTNRELDEARKQAVRATLSAMAGGYIHRLNGALGFIPASLDDVMNKVDTGAHEALRDAKGGVEEALAYTKRMTQLFTGQELPRESVDANLMLETVVNKIRVPSKIRVGWELAPDLPEIIADKMFLAEVFNNMVMNALEAMADKTEGDLQIGTRQSDGEVRIWITDNGCGILPESMTKILEPDFTTKPGRHGIGLWFCDTVVRVHGGHIDVDSNYGVGSTFTVVLPIGRPEPVDGDAEHDTSEHEQLPYELTKGRDDV